MRVKNENDRQEKPEKCDMCNYRTTNLTRYHFGPGHNVVWICHYCGLMYTPKKDNEHIKKTMSVYFNELEKRLIKEIRDSSYRPRPI